MHSSSLQYIKCVKCGRRLHLDIFEQGSEIDEGVLTCTGCKSTYPIILSIPLLIEDLPSYFSIRSRLGGYLLLHAKNPKIKLMIKRSLQKIRQVGSDTTDLDKNWAGIYKKSRQLQFKTKMKNVVSKLPRCDFVVEHGCSIGTMSEILAARHGTVFGVDKSFFALLEAKRRKIKNADFLLADSLSQVFGKMKFDLVVALNVLELIEPSKLLQVIGKQARRFVVLADPYDYERGNNSVKTRLDAVSLRKRLDQMGFKLIHGTGKPSFVSWSLDVNPRLRLHYRVDLIVAGARGK